MSTVITKMLKMLLIIGCIISAGLLFIACEPPEVETRVAWWGNPTRDEHTNKVIELYQEKYPNVTINPEFVGWGGYWEKINTQAAGNDLPDVMQHDYAYLLQFVNRDLMEDLNPYVTNKTIDLSTVDETFLSGGRVNGKLYGVSLGTNAVCVVYDPAVLKNAGITEPTNDWTWDDFEKIATQVYEKTKVQTLPVFPTDPRVGFENWIRQTGASFYANDGKSLGFTDPAPLEAFFDLQIQLIKKGVMIHPDISFVTVTMNEDQFTKGNSWVQYVWSNQVVATQAAANRPVKVLMVPNIKNAKRPGTFLKPSMFFAIPKTSANKEEGARFINFFLNDTAARKILLSERGIPITPAIRETIKAEVDPVSQQIFDYIGIIGNGKVSPIDPPDPASSGEILKLLKDATQSVLSGKMSAKDGTAKFMTQANEILSKNK